MRVTNGMVINTSLNGLYNNMNAINKTYAQMTTGKKIQTVSDDPIIAGRALKLKTTVLETSQYESNTKEAMSWMEVTEASLANMTKILTSIRTKCVEASTGTLEKDDIEAIQADINQLWKQLQDEANATYGGRYIFSGYKTNEKLMIEENDEEKVNPEILDKISNHSIEYEIGVNTTITVNTTGMDTTFNNMAQLFNTINDEMANTDDSSKLNKFFTEKIDNIDVLLADISEKTSDLGSRMNRVEYTQERLGDQKITFKNLLSDTEDIDVEEVYTKFNVQYATYQSALQATAKIMTNTLADYL